MKITRMLIPCVLVALLLSGCRAQYRASGMVLVETKGTKPSQATIDAEMQAIRKMAPAFVSADWSYNVQHISGTSLINVSVTTPTPKTSASQCNQIIQKYVKATNAPVTRKIVEEAAIPKERIR